MTKREVLGRYRGSVVGLGWSFFNPLLMLSVYTFFFSYVFKSRWGDVPTGGHTDFAIVLFVGLIIHGVFAECINRAPALINSNVSYVKKVVFPLEIFPWIAMGSALFHAGISIFVLVILQLIIVGNLQWTIIFFPLVTFPFVIVTLGFAWFLAATGVYVRDIGQTTGLVTSVMLFVSPVFYPIATLPHKMQLFVMLNPLTLIIEESRKVLLFGEVPNWTALGVYSLVSMVIAWIGFWWFQKTRKGFADVL
ncbi:ABC transporter permease [Methylophilus sp. QUAN]|uniref:ABC transporter permease n=1 Tax=Methylophilus sp. QUAN TaxID=2781020 RepID=UPI002106A5A4|nr:ABC transporter permease [Methylophilus sp. QUAN]